MTLKGARAVQAHRHEPPDSLDDFPTPPWATRALFEYVLPACDIDAAPLTVWEPACGRGLMAFVIAEYARRCIASDVHDYGYRSGSVHDYIGSFTGEGPDTAPAPPGIDAIITNPPFRLADAFMRRALSIADFCALLLPTRYSEGVARYRNVFEPHPPAIIGYFVERVPMHRGRWVPHGSTATAYAWFVWRRDGKRFPSLWIPPGQRQSLTRDDDIRRAHALGALGEKKGALL